MLLVGVSLRGDGSSGCDFQCLRKRKRLTIFFINTSLLSCYLMLQSDTGTEESPSRRVTFQSAFSSKGTSHMNTAHASHMTQ